MDRILPLKEREKEKRDGKKRVGRDGGRIEGRCRKVESWRVRH